MKVFKVTSTHLPEIYVFPHGEPDAVEIYRSFNRLLDWNQGPLEIEHVDRLPGWKQNRTLRRLLKSGTGGVANSPNDGTTGAQTGYVSNGTLIWPNIGYVRWICFQLLDLGLRRLSADRLSAAAFTKFVDLANCGKSADNKRATEIGGPLAFIVV